MGMIIIDWLIQGIQTILHIDQHLIAWSATLGPWLYVIVGLIVFAETGLVVAPLLPGDSLLFALGAMTALTAGQGSVDATYDGVLRYDYLSVLLVTAAFIGDNLNYQVGKYLGPKVFSFKKSRFFNPEYLTKTQNFYLKYGAKAVILARFVPIVRTFVPFVAGIGRMPLKVYLFFSFFGAILWTQIFLSLGHFFGNLPEIKGRFHIVIFAIIFISIVPMLIAWIKSRQKNQSSELASNP
jgi:membrane-associated protein